MRSSGLAIGLLLLGATRLFAASPVRIIKIAVTNPNAWVRPREPIVVSLDDLRRRAPDLQPAHLLLTASDARTIEEDAAALGTEELPSQVDDLDGDGRLDELAFQVALGPHQTRVVSIVGGDPAVLARLRASYPRRTNALYSKNYEGPGWESELVAFRLYLDARNAIDVFGKRRPGLWLERWGGAEYDYHAESPLGRDIYKIGDALGIGSLAAFTKGTATGVRDANERTSSVRAVGPVRSIVEVAYKGWALGNARIDARSTIVQWAGERGFEHRAWASAPVSFVTALPRKPGLSQGVTRAVGSVALISVAAIALGFLLARRRR